MASPLLVATGASGQPRPKKSEGVRPAGSPPATPISQAIAYPVAVAVASAAHGIALAATLEAFGLAFASNLCAAAIRLSVVGQTDGQRVLAALSPAIHDLAAFASTAGLDDLGSAAFSADLCGLEHETQYTRLFRS